MTDTELDGAASILPRPDAVHLRRAARFGLHRVTLRADRRPPWSDLEEVARRRGPARPLPHAREEYDLDYWTSRAYMIFVVQNHAMFVNSPNPQFRRIHRQIEERC